MLNGQHFFLSGSRQIGTSPELWDFPIVVVNRWDEFCTAHSAATINENGMAGLRRDAVRPQVIDALQAQEIKETGNEED